MIFIKPDSLKLLFIYCLNVKKMYSRESSVVTVCDEVNFYLTVISFIYFLIVFAIQNYLALYLDLIFYLSLK